MKGASHGTDSPSVSLSGKSTSKFRVPQSRMTNEWGGVCNYVNKRTVFVFTVAAQCGEESMSFEVRQIWVVAWPYFPYQENGSTTPCMIMMGTEWGKCDVPCTWWFSIRIVPAYPLTLTEFVFMLSPCSLH